jgi:glycosyltransferase involved in cell wall biosynthesis
MNHIIGKGEIFIIMQLLTIGIPTYNSAPYISATIDSLKNQTYQDWKCLVSDDASSDNTLEIVRKMVANDPRFELKSQTNRLGPEGNWNFLLSRTETKYFKLLHADDLLHPKHLQILINTITANPECVLISSSRKFSKNPKPQNNEIKNSKYTRYSKNKFINKYHIQGNNFVGEPSFVIFDTPVLKKIGGFSKDWKYLIDMDTYIKVLNYGIYIKNHASLGVFRISSNSWSSTLISKQIFEEKKFLNHISNNSKKVYFGLFFINIRSFLRRLYFKIAQ